MKRKIYISLIACLCLLSCQKENASEMLSDGHCIYLAASVEGTKESRTPYTWSAPSKEHALGVDVWASTTSEVFLNSGKNGTGQYNNEVALHTTAKFTNASEQLLNDAVYPNSEDTKVYFVGMYPQGWTNEANNGKSASYVFNGSQDVMFAPQISGSYGENDGSDDKPWPVFQFKHLLTWLRLEIKAETEEVMKAWGKLKSIQVKSKNQVTIDLTKSAYTAGNVFDESIVTFQSTEADDEKQVLDVYATNTDQVLSNVSIPYNKYTDAGYVLCAPVTAKAEDAETHERLGEYTLIIKTEKRSLEVEVDLKTEVNSYFEGSTRRCQFNINLLFKMGNTISVSARAEEWKNGGIIINDVN